MQPRQFLKRIFLVSLSFAFLHAATAESAPIKPNYYDCQSAQSKVIFSTTSHQGGPTLTLKTPAETLNFHGQQIKTKDSPAGTIVTVHKTFVADSYTNLISLILPDI